MMAKKFHNLKRLFLSALFVPLASYTMKKDAYAIGNGYYKNTFLATLQPELQKELLHFFSAGNRALIAYWSLKYKFNRQIPEIIHPHTQVHQLPQKNNCPNRYAMGTAQGLEIRSIEYEDNYQKVTSKLNYLLPLTLTPGRYRGFLAANESDTLGWSQWSYDSTIFFDIENKSPPRKLQEAARYCFALSPTGIFAAMDDQNHSALHIFNTKTLELLFTLHVQGAVHAQFNATDSQCIMYGKETAPTLWSLLTKQIIKEFDKSHFPTQSCFSPDNGIYFRVANKLKKMCLATYKILKEREFDLSKSKNIS